MHRIAKIFQCGNSQAVRLPKDFRFDTDEVEIFFLDKKTVGLRSRSKNLARAFELLTQLPDDFFSEGRKDSLPQKRDAFE